MRNLRVLLGAKTVVKHFLLIVSPLSLFVLKCWSVMGVIPKPQVVEKFENHLRKDAQFDLQQ